MTLVLGVLMAAGCSPSTPASPESGSALVNGAVPQSSTSAVCRSMYRCCQDVQSRLPRPASHMDCSAFLLRGDQACLESQSGFQSLSPKLRANLPASCLE